VLGLQRVFPALSNLRPAGRLRADRGAADASQKTFLLQLKTRSDIAKMKLRGTLKILRVVNGPPERAARKRGEEFFLTLRINEKEKP